MRLTITAPGRLSHPGAVAWADDLYARIDRIAPIQRKAGREARRGKGGLDSSAKAKESASLLEQIPAGATAIALEVGGASLDSDRFYTWLIGLAERGVRDVCFCIGGPDGLDDRVRAACQHAISLSPMVLPHELAEVVLLEQLYRALTRWKNLPYHR